MPLNVFTVDFRQVNNQKYQRLKNKPNLGNILKSSKSTNLQARTTGSDIIIYTDEIKQIAKDDYVSYTMFMETPDTINNNFYNITIEDKNNNTSMFITKYSTTNDWLNNKTQDFEGQIYTYRIPTNIASSYILQQYLEEVWVDNTFNDNGIGGGSGGGSTLTNTYPYDCDGYVVTTAVITEINCACGHNWQALLTGECKGCDNSPRFPTMSTSYIYECINPFNGGDPSDGYYNGGGGPSSGNGNPNEYNDPSSITSIVSDPTTVCIPPEGDLNRDCNLDYNEAQFLIFYNDLTAEQQAIVDAGENTTDFFNYFSQNGFTDESREFIEELIDLELNGNLLSFFPTFKYPIGSNYSTLYPKLTEYLKNKIPQLINNQFIINKLVEYSELTSQQIKSDLKWGKGPTIQIAQLDYLGEDCYGVFRSSIPNVLTIDVDFVELLENSTPGPQGDSMAFLLGVTILHEYVHLGDFVDDIDQPGEEGLLFEQATYGETIWLNNAGDVLIKWQ